MLSGSKSKGQYQAAGAAKARPQTTTNSVASFEQGIRMVNPGWLVLEAVDGSGDASPAPNEFVARKTIDGHHGRMPQKSTELDSIADGLSDDRNDAHGRCLLVDHTDRHLICNDS